jgi:hypothetical protein
MTLLIAVLLPLAACQNTKEAVEKAAVEKEKAEAQVRIVKIAKEIPLQPKECGKPEYSGVEVKDRYDVAWKKADNALFRANRKGARCNAWLNNIRKGFAK